MRRRLLAVMLAAITLFAFAAPAAAYTPVTEGSEAHHWMERASGGYLYKIPACFDDTGDDAWPTTAGEPRYLDAIQRAFNSINAVGYELYFYVGSATCYQLYNHTYGVIPWVEFETHAVGSGGFASGLRDLDWDNDDTNDCTLWDGRCLEAIRISLDFNASHPPYGRWYDGTGTPPSNYVDVESTILHELGHSFIVGHCDVQGCPDSANMKSGFGAGGPWGKVRRSATEPWYLHDLKWFYCDSSGQIGEGSGSSCF